MRKLRTWLLGVLVFGCGGSGGDDTLVVDLSNQAQLDLCEQFLTDFCEIDPAPCDDACINAACPDLVATMDLLDTCGDGETAGQVDDCGRSGDRGSSACTSGGACVLEGLEAACP